MKNLREKFRQGGRKFIIGWTIWFVLKWSIFIFFGKSLFEWIR